MLNYKDFKLIIPDKNQVSEIQHLIDIKNGSIFHDYFLNEIVKETFNTQFYYLVDNPANISVFSPIHVTTDKYGLKRYNFKPLYDIPYAGFIGNEEPTKTDISIGFLESVKYEGFPHNNTSPLFYDRLGETSMVDLTISEDEIFETVIHSKRRNMIRKALKSGITIKIFHTSEGLEQFWPILNELHKYIKIDFLTYDYYNKIFQKFKNNKQAFILLAYKGFKAISGVFILGNKNYMHYYKGASLFDVKNEGQGELLQWEAIKYSKSLGTKFYDLCNLEKEKLPAIYRFKTGISNNIYHYPIFTNNKLGYKIIKRLLINDKD